MRRSAATASPRNGGHMADTPKNPNSVLAALLNDNIVVMQAAWIEWKRGGGAEQAMVWIHNTLWGPGLIPEGPYDHDAQKWFDGNRSDPYPRCWCGEPAHMMRDDVSACSDAHLLDTRAKKDGAA